MNIYQFLDQYRPYVAAPVSLRTGNIRLDYRGRRPDGLRSWYVIHETTFGEVNLGTVTAE